MAASDFEPNLFERVFATFGRWLRKIRDAVLGSGGAPDPSGVLSRRAAWNDEVTALMPELTKISAAGWQDASGKTYVSTNSFIIAEQALVANFLRRVPDEVYALIVAELIDGYGAGENVDELRDRIERVLSLTGTERWTNRARVIAQTEANRAWSAGVYASALYYEPITGRGWQKVWDTRMDGQERVSHRNANGQVVALRDEFQVGRVRMLYPEDPRAPASQVVNCRCQIGLRETP